MKNKLGSLKSMDCFVRGGGGGGGAFMVTRSIKARDRCRGNETMMKLWHLVKGENLWGTMLSKPHGGVSMIHMHTFNSKVGLGGGGEGAQTDRLLICIIGMPLTFLEGFEAPVPQPPLAWDRNRWSLSTPLTPPPPPFLAGSALLPSPQVSRSHSPKPNPTPPVK